MEQREKKRGDRFDGYWLRDEAPALGQFMAYLMPNRADNEAHINVDIDTRPLDAFLAKKNEGLTEDKYTYLHVFLAAMVKCFVLRPRMNRFISGNRLYMRDHISVSFVVKKRFEDKAEEGLAYKRYGEEDTIDTLHTSIMEEIHQCRREDVLDNSTDMMTKLLKLPRWVLHIVVDILFSLDRKGKVPYDLIKADPNSSSIFVTNLGSIGMDSGYHHLNNWGTNSFFISVGEKKLRPFYDRRGNVEMRDSIDVSFIIDERLADGFYYAKTIRLFKKLMENPELLERPLCEEVSF